MHWVLVIWFAAAGSDALVPARVMTYGTEFACIQAGHERVKTDKDAKRFVCAQEKR
jgi:hypothetical protein